MDKKIQIEIDEDLKKASDKLFKKLGLNTSTTIKIFLSMSVAKGGFPFEVKLPNASPTTSLDRKNSIINFSKIRYILQIHGIHT